VMQSLDSYFLAYYHGTETVGRYAVIYSICRIILATSMALNFFWYPVSVRMWQENRDKYLHYFRLLFSHGLLALFFLLLLLDANSRLIVSVFARNPEYQSVYPYLSLIAFAFVMQVLITLLTAPLYANEKPRWILAANLAGALASLALNLLLIPRFGILGASITAACSFLVVVLMLVWGTYRFCRFRFLEKRCLVSLPFAFALWAALALLRDRMTSEYGLLLSLLLLLASPLILYLSFLRESEKRFTKDMAKRLIPSRLRLKR
jgi:O-antigen/teichoic acid export membrane protein